MREKRGAAMDRPERRLEETPRRSLIGNVRIPKQSVFVGEPMAVKVVMTDRCPEDAVVTINGIPGRTQYLQFGRPGTMRVHVVATEGGELVERRTVEVEVVSRPKDCDGASLFPVIHVAQDFRVESGVVLRLGNGDAFSDRSVSYVWDLGDGVVMTSPQPVLRYSFADRLKPGLPFMIFDVSLHLKTTDNRQVFTGRRSVTVWNSYELSKRRGVIQPKVVPEIYARRGADDYAGVFKITNLEPEPIEFASVQTEILYGDPERLSTPGAPEEFAWTLPANETAERTFSVPRADIPGDAFGFAAHFRGVTKRTRQLVVASVYFEIRTNRRTHVEVGNPELVAVLDALKSREVFRESGTIDLGRLERELEERPHCMAVFTHGPVPTTISPQWIGKTLLDGGGEIGISVQALEGREEGTECSPEDEANPDDNLVCQLTDEVKWVYVPARIMNARKGDAILSPGGSGAIGGLLKQVSPAQVYSHSGIMVNNHYRLRHSTAADQWLVDSAGTEGLDPDKLKYGWPGTITQTVEQAYEGETMPDPDGAKDEFENVKQYTIRAFGNESTLIDGIGVVDPVVVKPDPLIEASTPQVRARLHEIAESAKKIDGHYRFYCYTRADIFFDDTYRAPERGGWWGSQSYPTVCSSLIWAAAKRLGDTAIAIESPRTFAESTDLEAGDIAAGAQVDYRTRDGLYYYTQEERRGAAEWLFNYFHNLAYTGAGALVEVFTDVADDTANQICNTFAFDWTGEDEAGNHSKDSERWRNPEDGRAVSPDNIRDYWDAPRVVDGELRGLYGYSEKLVYRPARLEQRRVSRWTRVETEGTLRGRVAYARTGALLAGVVVRVAGREVLTNGTGDFEITVPAGPYRVEAGTVVNGWYVSDTQDTTIAAGQVLSISLMLQDPPEAFREISVRGSMYIVDDEVGADETANRSIYMSGIRLAPSSLSANRSQIEKMGGEVRVEVYLHFTYQADASVKVDYTAKLFEGASEETDDLEDLEQGSVTVGRDETISHTIKLVNEGFNGGDTAEISLQITNDRQP